MRIRQSAAAVAIAGAVVLGVGACSDDADDTGTPASTSQSAEAPAPGSASAPAGESGDAAPAPDPTSEDLTNESAQKILRVAVDASSSKEDVEKVVDTSVPGTVTMIQAYAKASNAAGYTADIYTVKEVAVTGDTAQATVAIKSPHAPVPVDVNLSFAKIDGQWKLSSDAVKMLASFGQQYGG